MVLLIRSLGRLALRPTSRSLCTAGAARRPSIISTRAAPLRPNIFGSIRTLTEKREKVKVLLVLYDGKKHALDVSADLFRPSRASSRSTVVFAPLGGLGSFCSQ
jgi:formate dehydrogenase